MDRQVKTHCFNGHIYTIFIGGFEGLTDKFGKKAYTMAVNCDPNTQKGLISLIHEAMHAGNWDKHEKTIDRSSKEIGRLLWRLGWRVNKSQS